MFGRQFCFVSILACLVGGLLLTYSRLDATFGGLCSDDGECMSLKSLREKLSPAQPSPSTTAEKQSEEQLSLDDGEPKPKEQPHEQACKDFPDTSNILLVMKTGASEAYSKIPTQAVTMLRCLPDYLIFSDMEQDVAGQYIRDSLDTVLPEAQQGNPDFDLYRRQRNCPVDQETCNKGQDSAKQGWALDKYKNIHMAEKTYRLRPDYDWYFFVDADTYVFWPSLVKWLKKLNPNHNHYLGSAAMLGGFPFAHGGSGYLISKTLMKQMFEGKEGVANEWDNEASKTCCGDALLARALHNATDIKVQNMVSLPLSVPTWSTIANHVVLMEETQWPTINGEKPHTLQYGSRQWCQPIVTMHHLSAEEVASVWSFEQDRGFDSSVMRIKTLYDAFFAQHLQDRRDDWDNLSSDLYYVNTSAPRPDKEGGSKIEDWEVEKSDKKHWKLSHDEEVAHESVESCARACETMGDCMQWKYAQGLCILDKRASLGKPTTKQTSNGRKWTSGWLVERIKSWAQDHACEGGVKWPTPR